MFLISAQILLAPPLVVTTRELGHAMGVVVMPRLAGAGSRRPHDFPGGRHRGHAACCHASGRLVRSPEAGEHGEVTHVACERHRPHKRGQGGDSQVCAVDATMARQPPTPEGAALLGGLPVEGVPLDARQERLRGPPPRFGASRLALPTW
jgi:hypothetical protein